jgi:hypothetical protein
VQTASFRKVYILSYDAKIIGFSKFPYCSVSLHFQPMKLNMSTFIQMQAVIEAPYYEGEFLCPWEVPEVRPFSLIRLWGEMTYPEIGLVFAQLAQYNQIKLSSDKQVVLKQILKAKSLVLPGGIQVVCTGQDTISPSCCCGLETWREWIDFLKTGQSPWLGHDPSPWVEGLGDIILFVFGQMVG